MNATVPVYYHLAAYKKEQLWLPAGLCGLFVIMIALFRPDNRTVVMAGAFLHFVLPLIAGILAASALVDDPALELHLASPRRSRRTLLERLGMLLAIVVAIALLFQAYLVLMQVPMSHFGGVIAQQLAWLAPCLAMMSLVNLATLLTAQATTGALVGGIVWIMQVLLHSFFEGDPWLRYVALFMGDRLPDNPVLRLNQFCLILLATAMLVLAMRLLQREERYL